LGFLFAARQARIETPTSGYFLLDVTARMRLRGARHVWTLFISGVNLTKQTYYDHPNRRKDIGVHNPRW
jgi:hypothetical protein